LDQRCPKAIPVPRNSTMLRRFPHAALWRSPRFAGLGFRVDPMNDDLSFSGKTFFFPMA
jgi:hypothetical protein